MFVFCNRECTEALGFQHWHQMIRIAAHAIPFDTKLAFSVNSTPLFVDKQKQHRFVDGNMKK